MYTLYLKSTTWTHENKIPIDYIFLYFIGEKLLRKKFILNEWIIINEEVEKEKEI